MAGGEQSAHHVVAKSAACAPPGELRLEPVAQQIGGGKRAVGFKLSDGMEVPQELGKFKFARQKSKLAGTIRGSYFVIKNKY